jgi:preprotein translocase subunit SecG
MMQTSNNSLQNMQKTITILQMIFAALMSAAVLMQSRGASVGSLFGGSGGVYRTKRGVEKILFYATIIFAILFLGLSLVSILISQ